MTEASEDMETQEQAEIIAVTTFTEGTEGAEMKNVIQQSMAGGEKPLYRFIRGQPGHVGIAVLMFGCGELLCGMPMIETAQFIHSSSVIYLPFWLGVLFIISGSLSIYTGKYPSKSKVTLCLAFYIVSLLGIFVSLIVRLIFLILRLSWFHEKYSRQVKGMVTSLEAVLLMCSVCVFVLLCFLCSIARAALKSSMTRVIVHQTLPASQTDS
ncbi:membrane-spanning 4-domains subfamily A member 4D-like [Chanos chanos]|uniref:Membrane-spanning 4-domains subfamily A member 4D-like n=1 Tax=Chanos chanos TaxID=29144 RepID=A0A6J2W3Q0_CHACN|nr:membrane-spanning 4-domains subfamily A member 4D-like [Chanos chanos]